MAWWEEILFFSFFFFFSLSLSLSFLLSLCGEEEWRSERKLAISWKSKLPSAAATGASYFQKMALALPSSIMHSGIQNRNKEMAMGQSTMVISDQVLSHANPDIEISSIRNILTYIIQCRIFLLINFELHFYLKPASDKTLFKIQKKYDNFVLGYKYLTQF